MSMNLKITKSRVAAVVAAAVLVAPATAVANHVFDDVPDGAFYAEPVDWAFANGITTGKSPTSFAPLDNVTRGESVTFLQRYHENLVEPGQTRASGVRDEDAVNDWDGTKQTQSTTITAPTNGYLVIDYTATVTTDKDESATGSGMITATVEVDGVEQGETFGGVDFDAHWHTNFNTLNISKVIGVAAGEHTVDGSVTKLGFPSGGLAYIYNQNISVMFVPLNGAGKGPT